MRHYMIRVPIDLLKKAKIAAIEVDMPLSEIMRQLLVMWLTKKVKLTKTK